MGALDRGRLDVITVVIEKGGQIVIVTRGRIIGREMCSTEVITDTQAVTTDREDRLNKTVTIDRPIDIGTIGDANKLTMASPLKWFSIPSVQV